MGVRDNNAAIVWNFHSLHCCFPKSTEITQASNPHLVTTENSVPDPILFPTNKSAIKVLKMRKSIEIFYSLVSRNLVVALQPGSSYKFYSIVNIAFVLSVKVSIPLWALVHVPVVVTLTTVFFTHNGWAYCLPYVLFENSMGMVKIGALLNGTTGLQWEPISRHY